MDFIIPPTLFFCQDSQGSEERGEGFPEKNKKVLLEAAAVRSPVLEVFFQLPNPSRPLRSNLASPPLLSESQEPALHAQETLATTQPTGQRGPMDALFLPKAVCLSGPISCPVSRGYCFLSARPVCPVVQGPGTQQHAVLKEKPLGSGQTGHIRLPQGTGHPERRSRFQGPAPAPEPEQA